MLLMGHSFVENTSGRVEKHLRVDEKKKKKKKNLEVLGKMLLFSIKQGGE